MSESRKKDSERAAWGAILFSPTGPPAEMLPPGTKMLVEEAEGARECELVAEDISPEEEAKVRQGLRKRMEQGPWVPLP